MGSGFSFATVILSYFLVGGGMFSATLVANQLGLVDEIAVYAAIAVGAFVGGFVSARASRGETILEPAIGAIAVIATIVGLGSATPMGEQIWTSAHDETLKFVGIVGVASVVGAVLGALLSERLFGEATQSSIPWILYTGMSVFGACLVATLLASIFFLSTRGDASNADSAIIALVLIGLAVGCLVAGLAVGASARVRPLLAAFLGGALGLAGFLALVMRTTPTDRSEAVAGVIVTAILAGLLTLIGTAIGWAAIGKKYVSAHDPAQLARQFQ